MRQISLSKPSPPPPMIQTFYNPGGWHMALTDIAICVVQGLFKMYAFHFVRWFELFSGLLHLCMFFVYFVDLGVVGSGQISKSLWCLARMSHMAGQTTCLRILVPWLRCRLCPAPMQPPHERGDNKGQDGQPMYQFPISDPDLGKFLGLLKRITSSLWLGPRKPLPLIPLLSLYCYLA